MTSPPTEFDLAGLQLGIRRAGRGVRALRLVTAGCVLASALLLALAVFSIITADSPYLAPADPAPLTLVTFLRVVGPFAGSGAFLGVVVALPIAFFYRWSRRLALWKVLGALPREAQAAVLLPLRHERLGDTRKIVAPLIRDFALPTEVTPAPTTSGRGDEVTPEP